MAFAVHGADAEHVVAHRPPGNPAGAGEVGGDDTADAGHALGAKHGREVGRFGYQVLALRRQAALDLRHGHAGAGGNHQLLRRIERDATKRARVDLAGRLHRAQHPDLRRIAANAERLG